MLKTFEIIKNTFIESFSKFTFVVIFIISNLIILFFLFIFDIDIVENSIAILHFVEKTSSDQIVAIFNNIKAIVAIVVFYLVLLLSIIGSADLIPNMLKKGYVDLYLSKPISRTHLLISKFFGGLSIVVVNVLYVFICLYLILSIKAGIWDVGFLYAGLYIILIFAVYYAFMMFLGLLTRNTIIIILVTYLIGIIDLISSVTILANMSGGVISEYFMSNYKGVYYTFSSLSWILPNHVFSSAFIYNYIVKDEITFLSQILSTVIFGLIFIISSLIIFRKKDF